MCKTSNDIKLYFRLLSGHHFDNEIPRLSVEVATTTAAYTKIIKQIFSFKMQRNFNSRFFLKEGCLMKIFF